MTTSKSLASGVAAAALVATIGLAYAQTSPQTTSQPPAATDSSTMPQSGMGAAPAESNTAQPATTAAQPSTMPAADSPAPSSSTDTELAPKADRN